MRAFVAHSVGTDRSGAPHISAGVYRRRGDGHPLASFGTRVEQDGSAFGAMAERAQRMAGALNTGGAARERAARRAEGWAAGQREGRGR